MPALPIEIVSVLGAFAPVFTQPIWIRAQYMVCGAILSNGPRTICSILRTLGLSRFESFQNYHRFFNRANWSSGEAAQILLKLLVSTFARRGSLVIGIDEVLERRWGKNISARGIYRDSARSSKSFLAKSSGLRWISLHLLVPIPWAKRIWALPFLTKLAPSERYHKKHGLRHKKIIDWAQGLIGQLRRWWPDRDLIVLGDSTYSALELLHSCQKKLRPVTFITRLRLDAALYAPAPRKRRMGRPPLKGKRLPTLAAKLQNRRTKWQRMHLEWYGQKHRWIEFCTGKAVWYHSGKPPVTIRWVLVRDSEGDFKPQAFLSTKDKLSAGQIVRYFMRRWPMEVTFQEVRTHLGMDGQRQWNDKAIARTTPCLLGLFSLVTLMANQIHANTSQAREILWTAWYKKEDPTFSDALAWVRNRLWREESFWTSVHASHNTKTIAPIFKHMTNIICRAG